ncbi:hypothetical protein FS749_014168 [Ceratobasidium sp. UAMH 11750]|nr:hypothetical protein FS749_014168 [Ceratobasidium sp. UAMH 11750]
MSAPATRPMGPHPCTRNSPQSPDPRLGIRGATSRATARPSCRDGRRLGPPTLALSPPPGPRPPSSQPESFLGPNCAPGQGPSATPIPTPMPNPGLVPFQAPPPPPPLPGRTPSLGPASGQAIPRPTLPLEESIGGPIPSELVKSSRMGLYSNPSANRPQLLLRGSSPVPAPAPVPAPSPPRLQSSTAPLKPRPKPRVEVPHVFTPSELDSADADDERVVRTARPKALQHSSFER